MTMQRQNEQIVETLENIVNKQAELAEIQQGMNETLNGLIKPNQPTASAEVNAPPSVNNGSIDAVSAAEQAMADNVVNNSNIAAVTAADQSMVSMPEA